MLIQGVYVWFLMLQLSVVVLSFEEGKEIVGNFDESTESRRKNYLEDALDEGLSIWVVSHGGVASNMLATNLENQGIRSRSKTWHSDLCHQEKPIASNRLKGAIYLFGDPILAVCSMKRRNNANLNLQKLTGNANAVYSDNALIDAMYKQFKAWTSLTTTTTTSYPIVRLRYEDTFNQKCIDRVNAKLRLHYRAFPMLTVRQSSRESCVQYLNLDDQRVKLAKEIAEYNGDCGDIPDLTPQVLLKITREEGNNIKTVDNSNKKTNIKRFIKPTVDEMVRADEDKWTLFPTFQKKKKKNILLGQRRLLSGYSQSNSINRQTVVGLTIEQEFGKAIDEGMK